MNPSTSENSPFLLAIIFGQMGKIPKVIVKKQHGNRCTCLTNILCRQMGH
jgi:hypothetical protein